MKKPNKLSWIIKRDPLNGEGLCPIVTFGNDWHAPSPGTGLGEEFEVWGGRKEHPEIRKVKLTSNTFLKQGELTAYVELVQQ